MVAQTDWKSDFFGTLNEMPAEPVDGIAGILEAMAALPAFNEARSWMLRGLGIGAGSAVLEAGCGTGIALSQIRDVVGASGRIAGLDPTVAFVSRARERAAAHGAANAAYDVGDIRALPFPEGEFDAAFCDKVLIHTGPATAAVAELKRVTRSGGRVGAVEWMPFFTISNSNDGPADTFNGIFRASVSDYYVSANLARHFRDAGLEDVHTESFLAHTNGLDSSPFWRAFIIDQLPLFVQAGLIAEAVAEAFRRDLEDLDSRNEFAASFIVRAATGSVRRGER